MSTGTAITVTLALLVASGFFVAAEFALVGARRHRLEQAAAAGKPGARAALKGVRELSLMLAGAQLGITMVVVGLGMVSEPALHHLLEPPLSALGLPSQVADVVALVLALAVVTFLHVVIGEMAPKSWAIAHPERSAMILAPAFRAFTWVTRWLLVALNGVTNLLLRVCRVTPRDEIATVRNREQIHHLVSESRRLGLISDGDHGLLTRALDAPAHPVGEIMVPAERIVQVGPAANAHDVVEAAAASERTRVLVRDPGEEPVGVVHVREALVAQARGSAWTAGEAATPVPHVRSGADLTVAAELLRAARAQLAVVVDDADRVVGLVSLDDLIGRILVS